MKKDILKKGWKPSILLENGIKNTDCWFLENQNSLKEVKICLDTTSADVQRRLKNVYKKKIHK